MDDDEVEQVAKEILRGYAALHNGDYRAAWLYLDAAASDLKGATCEDSHLTNS